MTFIFPNSWDDDDSDFHIFQRGWNHQPVYSDMGPIYNKVALSYTI